LWAEVDEQGRLVLPQKIAAKFGLQSGALLRIEEGKNDLRLHRPVTQLTKIYVEPTNRCNLDCRTCIRNEWESELGQMSEATFERLMESLAALEPRPVVHFSGLGEPLFHKKTPEMIARAHELGCYTEMITNSTLLTVEKGRHLIDAGLDMLWVSLDGATPESYADVRLGAELPNVLANLRMFRKLRKGSHHPKPEIGVAFVAMKRNIHELRDVIRLGRSFGAKQFMVSNVLPYTAELEAEMLYKHTLKNIAYLPSPWLPRLSLPKMDLDETTQEAFLAALNSNLNVTLAGNNLGGSNDVCTFIESGSIAVGWQGDVAPCPPLLHTHTHLLHTVPKPRRSLRHIVGNVNQEDIKTIWEKPEYIAYRQRVQSFAFAPCTYCGGCELTDDNRTDCFWNPFPACGGCLWAQAVIQCP
jgi:MoaA/NifB/PqqE/SkfB family radical SAM enzyme